MTAGEQTHDAVNAPAERRFPPITEMTVGSMLLVIIGGIYLAAQIPGSPALAPAVGLLIGAVLLLLADVVTLSGLHNFAWQRFALVFGWALLAYAIVAGMIGYVFVADGTRGGSLIVLSLMLLVFAVDIPLLLGFSVARYQEVE